MKLVRLDTYPNEMEARLVANILENEKVLSVVKPMGGGYGGLGVTQWIFHAVFVDEDDLKRATDIMASTEILPDTEFVDETS